MDNKQSQDQNKDNHDRREWNQFLRGGVYDHKKELSDQLNGIISPTRVKRKTIDKMAKRLHSKRKASKQKEYSIRRAMRGTYKIPEHQTDVMIEFKKRTGKFKFEGSFTGNFNVAAEETSHSNLQTNLDEHQNPKRRVSRSSQRQQEGSIDNNPASTPSRAADIKGKAIATLVRAAELIRSDNEASSPMSTLDKTEETINNLMKDFKRQKQKYKSKEVSQEKSQMISNHRQEEDFKQGLSLEDHSVTKDERYQQKPLYSSDLHADLKVSDKIQRSIQSKSVNMSSISIQEQTPDKELSSIGEDIGAKNRDNKPIIRIKWTQNGDEVQIVLEVQNTSFLEQKDLVHFFSQAIPECSKRSLKLITDPADVILILHFLTSSNIDSEQSLLSKAKITHLTLPSTSASLSELLDLQKALPELQLLNIESLNFPSNIRVSQKQVNDLWDSNSTIRKIHQIIVGPTRYGGSCRNKPGDNSWKQHVKLLMKIFEMYAVNEILLKDPLFTKKFSKNTLLSWSSEYGKQFKKNEDEITIKIAKFSSEEEEEEESIIT